MDDPLLRKTRRKYFAEVGRRLRDVVQQTVGSRGSKRIQLEDSVATQVGVSRSSCRRWYSGENAPDLFVLSTILRELNRERDSGFDANFVLFGTDRPVASAGNAPDALHRKLDDLLERVHVLADYVRDHELGVEGVVMRQSIRMLEDLRATRPTQVQRTVSDREEPLVAGILPDDLIEIVESCSTRVRCATSRLDYLLQTTANPLSTRPGRFLRIAGENLAAGRSYDFILPPPANAWAEKARECRSLLTSRGLVSGPGLSRLRFHISRKPLVAGFVLFDLDIEAMQTRRPMLAKELLTDYIPDESGRAVLGAIIPPSRKMHAFALMDPERVDYAIGAWRAYMDGAETLP